MHDSQENLWLGPLEPESINCQPSNTFRCTCHRTGVNSHCFASTDVARSFGGLITDTFGWKPKMKDHDLDVVVNIDLQQVKLKDINLKIRKNNLFIYRYIVDWH